MNALQPVKLDTFDPRWLALHNRLHRSREPWRGECAGHDVTLYWGTCSRPEASVVKVLLGLGEEGDASLAAAPCAIKLGLPVQVLPALDLPVELDVQGSPGAMLLELALLSLIEPLERLTGQSIRMIDRDDPLHTALDTQTFDVGLTLRVDIDELSLAVAVQLTHAAAEHVAQWLERHGRPASQPLDTLRLWLAVDAGEAELTVGELHSLVPGDVVMLDPWPETQVRLVLDRRPRAWALHDGATLNVLQTPIHDHSSKEPRMSETPSMSEAPDVPSLDSSLDDLPLTLVCQAGHVELTLAQLRELGEGSVLRFAEPRQHGVDLMVNGRRIGQGELVKIGDGLGVRLLSIAAR